MKFKHQILSAGIALSLSTGAMAGGIQIDPTGTGSIGASKFLNAASLGSSLGNFLANNILGTLAEQGSGDPLTGYIYGQNAMLLTSFGIPGAEITFEFSVAVTPAVTGTANTVGEQLSFTLDTTRTSSFKLYFDSTADANMDTGAGYNDGTLIASTTAVSFLNTAAITNTSGGVTTDNGGLLDDDLPKTSTISSNGSVQLALDFSKALDASNFVDPNYIVNDLTSAVIDLKTIQSLFTPFTDDTFASDKVVGVTPNYGTDTAVASADGLSHPLNNFRCIGASTAGECDFQASMNTTILTNAPQTPEPGTVALAGLGLGLLGLRARRRARQG
jgi:hypothetical protein